MDAALTMKKPKHLSLQEAATLGVGTYVRCLYPANLALLRCL